MNIRYGTSNDAAMLSALGAQTFRDAYAGQINMENIEAYVREFFSEESQVAEIDDPSNNFLIAQVDGEPVGYAKLAMNASHGSIEGLKPMEIGRIYLVQEHIGKGLGSALIRNCIHEAMQRGCDSLWLGVWEKNEKAIAFYQKWGFKQVGIQEFKLGNEFQTDLIMELPLDVV